LTGNYAHGILGVADADLDVVGICVSAKLALVPGDFQRWQRRCPISENLGRRWPFSPDDRHFGVLVWRAQV